MNLYVIRNKEGKFFRPIGYGGSGVNWQEKIEKAKFYPKVGTAKGQASFWFREYPEYGCPEILEFVLDPLKANVLDIQAETTKNIAKKKKAEQVRKEKYEAWLNSEPRPH